MATNEEKIKAFLNDEGFMEKVSGGTATAETYREELKKLDINLSNEEAAEAKKVTETIINTPVNELDGALLEQVTGGSFSTKLAIGGIAVSGISVAGSIGCGIAELVMKNKLNNAIKKGDLADIRKYNSIANKLEIAKYGAVGGAAIGGMMIVPGAKKLTSEMMKKLT